MRLRDRALGALSGLALGDALGMATQSWFRSEIASRYGVVDTLLDGAPDQPIAPNLPAGTITDDTEQALLLAGLLIGGKGVVDPLEFARALEGWEADMIRRGSLDLLGPSTRRALARLHEGESPERTGRDGTTNGAAMQITPVGIAVPGSDLEALVGAVVQAGRVTHNTGLGIAAAAAVAAAVSAGLDGAGLPAALDQAERAAEAGARRGHWVAGGEIAARIRWARGWVRGMGRGALADAVTTVIGTPVAAMESVVAAFALAEALGDDPHAALTTAASLGGDTDTVAAMCGAVLGAHHGVDACPRTCSAPSAGSTGSTSTPSSTGCSRSGSHDRTREAPVAGTVTDNTERPHAVRERTGRLIHTGQVVIDLVMRVPGLPPVGGDVLASSTGLHPGGGFTVMAAAARAGATVVYTGGHGTGRFGDAVRAALAEEGVEAAFPRTAGADTGICVVLVDDTGERSFITGSGAETAVDAAALAAIPVTVEDIVYVSGYSLLARVRAAVRLEFVDGLDGATVLVDPGPLVADIDPTALARLLGRTGVLSTNAREAWLMSALDDLHAAGHALPDRLSPGAPVVVRDGPRGCLLVRGGIVEEVPGVPVTAVDTTGAGDAHCGVLAAELLRGADPRVAAVRANAAAALAVMREGRATSPTRAEVDAVLGPSVATP